MPQPILLTVLGGYLGSGKTTLLNQLLRGGGGRGIAFVVNDFGSVNVDASLLEARDGDMLTLANGCICCSISAGFAEALAALGRRLPPPEHVIIETSGVADPSKVGRFGGMPPYRLDGVVVLADAATIRQRVTDKYVGETVLRQLRAADLIVLNKVDLVTQRQSEELRHWLQAEVPQARVLATSYGRVPIGLLLGLHEGSPDGSVKGREHRHHHDDDYATWSMSCRAPLQEAAFRAAVSAWPANVLRAKGIVYLAEDRARRHVFQLVGRRWSLMPDRNWNQDLRRSQVALIGLAGHLDGEQLLAGLSACQIPSTSVSGKNQE